MSNYLRDVSVSESWQRLSEVKNSLLIDVRTFAEWQYVGVPDLSSIHKKVIFSEWQEFPSMQINPNFIASTLKSIEEAGGNKETELFFLCRSGVRSQGAAAALTLEGYTQSMNILSGFEGPPNETEQRGTVSGWKVAGLPWVQG